jgi:hypothetical protein
MEANIGGIKQGGCYPGICQDGLQGLGKSTKDFNQDVRLRGRDLNPGLPE